MDTLRSLLSLTDFNMLHVYVVQANALEEGFILKFMMQGFHDMLTCWRFGLCSGSAGKWWNFQEVRLERSC